MSGTAGPAGDAAAELKTEIMARCPGLKVDSQGRRLAIEHIATARRTGTGAIRATLAPSIARGRSEMFYRAMSTAEYDALLKSGYLLFKDKGYGGITNSRTYCEEKYMGTGPLGSEEPSRGTHLVEFMVPTTLRDALRRAGANEKAEDGALSYGLGPGQNKGAGAQEYRNKSHIISWKLVALTVRSQEQLQQFKTANTLGLVDVTKPAKYDDD